MKHAAVLIVLLASLVYAQPPRPTITDLEVLREGLWLPATADARFDVTGYVAFVCDGDTTRIDLVAGETHHQFWFTTTDGCSVRSGDLARLRGHFGPPPENIRREISSPLAPYIDEAIFLGKAPPRHFDEISGGRLICGDFTNASVSVRGVISGAHRDELNANWNWFVLRTRTGKVFVATPEREHSLQSLKELADSEATVCGTATPTPRFKGLANFQLLPIGDRGIVCTKQTPEDPFSRPPLENEKFRRMIDPDPHEPVTLHRHLIRGRVLGKGDGKLFVLADGDVFCAITPLTAHPEITPGSHVTAVGFLDYGPSCLEFVEALVRLDSTAADPLPPGTPIDAQILSPSLKGKMPLNPRCYGEAVTLSGTVVNSTESIRHDGIVRLACGVHTVPVDIRALKDKLREAFDVGHRLTVTGISFGNFTSGRSTNDLPVFTGFTVYPRVPEDIVVISRPTWWTVRRLLAVILALVVLLVVILIWNRSLALLSDRRGKRLYLEAIAHTKAEMKVEERTHLAVELHDALSQTLTGVALQIDAASLANGGGNSRVGQVLEVAKSMLSSCRRELHNCLWDLRSRTFEERDMTEAVTRTLAPYSDGVGISVRFNVPRELFEEMQSHAILRMVRELAVNAITHGHATRLWIAGEHHDGTISFSVRDNGCGFDPNAVPGPQQGHFGLQGVRERLEKLDGCLDIRSEPGIGTKVSVRLRIQEQT